MKAFKVFHHNDCNYDSLALDSRRLNECIEEMQRTGIKSVHLNSEFGWKKSSSINFLQEHSWIEGVEILEDDIDVAVLNQMPNLKWLRLVGRSVKGQIDFNNLKNLLSFEAFWKKSNFLNFECCTSLQYVWISRCPWADFKILDGFIHLAKLKLHYGHLQTLHGISALRSMSSLHLGSFPHLSSVEELRFCNSLERLVIEKCKKIESYDALKDLRQLRALVLMESAPIDSVSFLGRFDNLEYAYMGLEILDKDVQVLKNKGIEFKRSKHYR